jgi:hypothetical protein
LSAGSFAQYARKPATQFGSTGAAPRTLENNCLKLPRYGKPADVADFDEGFVDGAARANNPIYEVWNEGQDLIET